MKKYILFLLAILLFAAAGASAQDSYNDRVKKYILQYYPYALAEQKSAGVPACITLAQGILETEAGGSELMTQANNHFGIKCKNNWQGETFLHDDDEKAECFKKYGSAAESFKDHSDHLKRNPRYAMLFTLSETDYAAWALGLKKCGYATNPQYAVKLIKLIEDFKLQQFTYNALDSSILSSYAVLPPSTALPPAVALAADSMRRAAKIDTTRSSVTGIKNIADSARARIKQDMPVAAAKPDTDTLDIAGADGHYDSSKIVRLNGLKAFYAYKGDILLQYAVKYHIRFARLLEINDLPDAPLPYDMYVYLERKMATGTHPTHTVQEGETMFAISQAEGIQLKKLLALNLLNPNEQPFLGTVLQLQQPALEKPDVKVNEVRAHKNNAIISIATEDPQQGDGYIAISRPQAPSNADAPPEAETTTAHAAEAAGVKTEKAPVAKPVTKEVAAANAAKAREAAAAREKAEKDAELAALKADLDKEVYAGEKPAVRPHANEPAAAKYEKPQPVAAPKGDKYYTIKRGDTAFSIAKRNNITVNELMKWNDIDADDIKIGRKILVRQ